MRTFASISKKKASARSTHTLRPPVYGLDRTRQAGTIRHILGTSRIQPKLTVGAPNDVCEQEADRAADAVMRMPDEASARRPLEGDARVQLTPLGNDANGADLQRQVEEEEEEEELLQPKSEGSDRPPVTPALEGAIAGRRGTGRLLPAQRRAFFEPRMQFDFSKVNVHTDNEAAQMNQALGARAFTYGRDIFFGAGEYAPETQSGEHLLAHELAHVIQQGRSGAYPATVAQQAGLEQAADIAAAALTTTDHRFVSVSGASANWLACNRRSSRGSHGLRRGTADGVQFQEGPRDVIALRLSNISGDMSSILSSIDAVMANFGSADRSYVRALDFAALLAARLAELGHPAATGGGSRMSRDRWLTIRVRIVRGQGGRIEGLRLMPQAQVTEAPEGLAIEGEQPEPVLEVRPPVVEAPREEPAESTGWRGWAESIGEGLEAAGDLVSGRWFWDPIMDQMAEWERDLAAIGETEGRTIEVSGTEAALIPIGILFTVIYGILGTANLLAEVNPYNLVLRELSRRARALSGSYTRAQFERDMRVVGEEAWGILTLGLGRAIDHMREGIRDANTFRTTQAVTEIVMAIEAVIGLVAGVRSMSSSARMSAAVEAEAATGVEAGAVEAATRPTEPGPGAVERSTVPAPDLPYRTTEPGAGAAERATVPEPDLPYRTTESGAGAAERATVPEADLPHRATEPGVGAAERTTVPEPGLAERPTEAGPAPTERTATPEQGPPTEGRPTGPTGGLRVRRPIRDLAEARQLRDRLVSEAEGVELMPDHAYFAEEYRALGGTGEVPYAYEQTNGRVVFDTTRVGWPSQQALRRGAVHQAARARAAREARVAAEAAMREASAARWQQRVDTPVEARAAIDRQLEAGMRRQVRLLLSEETYLSRWRAAGGGDPVPVAFFDTEGVLWVNQPGLGGM
ncbi:hypothetical protein DSCO28_28070 [Desulfosarcina ovata subsp. sediminis]|uniref:eCIS core domain-containing protein n=1 Tax=Desulfosarcina ovata subsp. sediminis TaxID=885957 RepID=A0A5K7ZMH3_9BACT|nr:DUF4157 domain-containing protein [Desulfosarcina ovata]BBO82241.1 hypothetical protein DSCO28_28070 [Desulfosarcina ovata subsp. sediminis]